VAKQGAEPAGDSAGLDAGHKELLPDEEVDAIARTVEGPLEPPDKTVTASSQDVAA
jgi:hypothetical protein